jgi:hypothetical protein
MTPVLLYPFTDRCKISPAQASEIKMPSNIKGDTNIEGIPGFKPRFPPSSIGTSSRTDSRRVLSIFPVFAADMLLGGQLCPTDDSV